MVGILAEVAIYLLPLAAVTQFYSPGSTPCSFIRQFVNKEVLESISIGLIECGLVKFGQRWL